jgi:hypothetical protein
MLTNRRKIVLQVAAIACLSFTRGTRPVSAKTDGNLAQTYDSLLSEATPDLVAKIRGLREYVDLTAGLETAPTQEEPSATPISSRATELLIHFEVSSGEVYEKLYQAPTWPKGSSGVTIGVGYDLGYADGRAIRKDWSGYLEKPVIDRLVSVSGIIGMKAKSKAAELSSISISFGVARQQFLEIMQPRYVGMTERALGPKFGELPEDCRGALVSLVYNRGASFDIPERKDPKGRYSEMRNIKKLIEAGKYQKVPEEIRAMRRLWMNNTNLKGVVLRRELEATLFAIGLQNLN